MWPAQAAPPPGEPIAALIQYGVLGLVLVALLGGWLWTRPSVQQLIKDKERAEAQRDELLRQHEERIVPVLAEFTAAASTLARLLEEVLRRLPDDPGRG